MTQYCVKALILLLTIVSVLYGTSYLQFRHFNIEDPRGSGASDASSYIAMSHGNYDVNPTHRYRPLIPYAAGIVRRLLQPVVHDEREADKLSFYVANFVVATGTALLLFAILRKAGFSWQLSLFGVAVFLSSRITVQSVGTPLVDSLYYFAIAVIIYLILVDKTLLLAWLCPLLVLSKETILPFLFLPLFVKNTRSLKMVCSVAASLAVFFLFRHFLALETEATERPSFSAIVMAHVHAYVLPSLRRLLTLEGIHDLFSGFAFFVLLAPWGLYFDLRKPTRGEREGEIPSAEVSGCGDSGRTNDAEAVWDSAELELIPHSRQ